MVVKVRNLQKSGYTRYFENLTNIPRLSNLIDLTNISRAKRNHNFHVETDVSTISLRAIELATRASDKKSQLRPEEIQIATLSVLQMKSRELPCVVDEVTERERA